MIGMDFGTTNTGAAIFDGQEIHTLLLDPLSQTPGICRTAVYMTRSGDYYLGSGALNTYFLQNLGRPTRYRKIWIGEIIQVFAELPTFYRDVYVYEDEFSPGRLFTSIKSVLRNREYFGTAFQGNWYTASDLVAVFLTGMKMQIESQLDQPVDELVIGRPVHFSQEPQEDQVAQTRLLEAVFKAGFRKVYLEYEPVAAALAYERGLAKPERVLVFDFGGGTLDFTVMEIGIPGAQRVLATGGIPIAGDIFDQHLFRTAVPKHLGEGEQFSQSGRLYPIPAHIFDSLSNPQEILVLNTPEHLEMLRLIHQGAQSPGKIAALRKIVSSNYAMLIFDLVEQVKRQLSVQVEALLSVETDDFSFSEPLTRRRFERAIAHEYDLIRQELLATLSRSGLAVPQIDRVIRTGGSSQIPLFVNLLHELFGHSRVHAIDVFTSVTAGLAIRGQQIEAGEVDSPAYTRESLPGLAERTAEGSKPGEVQQIDLAGVGSRLRARQQAQAGSTALPDQVLLLVAPDGLRLFPADDLPSAVGQLQARLPQLPPGCHFVRADLASELLLATNQFKLISFSVNQLYLAQQADPYNPVQALPLVSGEVVTAIIPWSPAAPQTALIGMVTITGQGRVFEARLLANYLQHRPYFELEQRYRGFPVELLGLEDSDLYLAGTTLGRVAAAAPAELSLQPADMLRLRPGEVITAAGCAPQGAAILALSERGRLRQVDPAELPTSGPPGGRARTLQAGIIILAFLQPGEAVRLLTSRGRLLNFSIPAPLPAKPVPVQLYHDERITGVIR